MHFIVFETDEIFQELKQSSKSDILRSTIFMLLSNILLNRRKKLFEVVDDMVKTQVNRNPFGSVNMPEVLVVLALCQMLLFGTAFGQIPTVGGQCPTKTPSGPIDMKKVET